MLVFTPRRTIKTPCTMMKGTSNPLLMLNENRREGKSEPITLKRTRGLLRKALQLATVEKNRFCIVVLYSHVKSGSLASGQSWATAMSSTVTRSSPQDAARAGAILMWKDIIEEFVEVNTDSEEDDEELD